jgi:hypothetical protein
MATLENEGDVNAYFRNIMTESERGKVILLAAKIDELLGELLKRYFKPSRAKDEKDDKVFRIMGLLGTFSARIEMAHRVGLISREAANCYDLLREIRNDCAHGQGQFTYTQGSNADKFRSFKEMSFKVSGMEKFFTLVEKVHVAEGGRVKDLQFMMLTMVHILMLQETLKHIKPIVDSFRSLENVKFGFEGLGIKS